MNEMYQPAPRTVSAYGELGAAALIIGSSVTAGKVTAAQLPVFLSQAASLAIALLVLLPLVWIRHRHGAWRVSRRDLLLLILTAFGGMFLFRVFMLYGLRYASAAEGAMITGLTPAAVALLSRWFLGERIAGRAGTGILCSLAGIAVIQLPQFLAPGGESRPASLTGMLLLTAAVVSEAGLSVLRKKLSPDVPSLLAVGYITAFALPMFLAGSAVELLRQGIPVIHPADVALVVYYGICVTALAYILWFRGAAKVTGGTIAVFTALIPVCALGLSHFVMGEPLYLRHFAGAGLVLAGILLVSGFGFGRRRGNPCTMETGAPSAPRERNA